MHNVEHAIYRSSQNIDKRRFCFSSALLFVLFIIANIGLLGIGAKGHVFLYVLLGFCILFIAVYFIFFNLTLNIAVDFEYLYIAPSPLAARKISIVSIIKLDELEAEQLKEYGGIKLGRSTVKGETAYLINGEKGVRIHLAGGEKILLGAEDPEKIIEVLRYCLKRRNIIANKLKTL